MLRKTPFLAAAVLATFALGIGASTAIFTVVDSVLLKPLAYRDSGRLVTAWERAGALAGGPVGPNPRHFDLWRKRADAFRDFTLLRHFTNGLTLGAEHPRVVAIVTSLPNLFDILQVMPERGRLFRDDDGTPGHDNVAVITNSLWQDLFQGDPAIVGKTFRLGDTPKQIIGVLPADFYFPNANALRAFHTGQPISGATEPAVFIPAALRLDQFAWNGEYGNWVALERLKPEVTIGQAAAQLKVIEAQVMGEKIGRAISRRREAAVRAAFGASARSLMWSGLAENLLLAAAGGALGIGFAFGGLGLFRRYSPIDLPRLAEVHLNGTVLLFALVLTVAASILSGLLPALRFLRTDPQSALQQSSSRVSGSRQSRRLCACLIGVQVFGCTALLLITGLFSKSLLSLLRQDKGFETSHVAVAEVRLTYRTDASRTAFDDAVLANLRAIPGVESAGLGSAMPLEGETWIEGIQRVDGPKRESLINLRWASPGYFETLKERLVAGRFLKERDRNLNSIVISESLAQALWPNENPIGGLLRVLAQQKAFTVVGVVADSRSTSLKSAPPRMAYVHFGVRTPYTTLFLVRGAGPADALISQMRQAIWKYAPDVTIARVKTLESQVTDSLATERLQMAVLIAFGAAALLLALLGIYGVLSYSVAMRKSEIGIRVALGATRVKIYQLALAEAGVPVAAGLATGLIGAVAAGRFIQSLLYGTRPVDLPVMAIVAGLFIVSAALASFAPARRAAAVDPLEALRSE
jgi:hypothetical protein